MILVLQSAGAGYMYSRDKPSKGKKKASENV
jgi:hypothetical protein